MPARYKGTCIGGIADGHWVERDDSNIRIDAQKRGADGNPVNIEHTDYQFLLLLGTSNVEIGVWAPQGTKLEDVVNRLVRYYNPRTGMIGEPKPNTIPMRLS